MHGSSNLARSTNNLPFNFQCWMQLDEDDFACHRWQNFFTRVYFKISAIIFLVFNSILPGGGGAKYAPLLFFLHHPKTAQDIKLKLSDFKDTLLRHILQVKPVR